MACNLEDKGMAQNVFLQMAANIMHPYVAKTQTAKNLGIDQDLTYHMWKFEDIPAVGKQDNDQCHTFQRWEIKHGKMQEQMNIWGRLCTKNGPETIRHYQVHTEITYIGYLSESAKRSRLKDRLFSVCMICEKNLCNG